MQRGPALGSAQNGQLSALAQQVNFTVPCNRRTVVVAGRIDATLFQRLAGAGVQDREDAAVLDEEHLVAIRDRGWTVRNHPVVFPLNVSFGDVPRSPGADLQHHIPCLLKDPPHRVVFLTGDEPVLVAVNLGETLLGGTVGKLIFRQLLISIPV